MQNECYIHEYQKNKVSDLHRLLPNHLNKKT